MTKHFTEVRIVCFQALLKKRLLCECKAVISVILKEGEIKFYLLMGYNPVKSMLTQTYTE